MADEITNRSSSARREADGRGVSLHDPQRIEALGHGLANLIAARAERRPDAVVVWERPETAVLGHVVTRELGVPLTLAYADEGLLGITAAMGGTSAVAVVSYDWTEYPGLPALIEFLAQSGTAVVSVASVLEAPAGAGHLSPAPVALGS